MPSSSHGLGPDRGASPWSRSVIVVANIDNIELVAVIIVVTEVPHIELGMPAKRAGKSSNRVDVTGSREPNKYDNRHRHSHRTLLKRAPRYNIDPNPQPRMIAFLNQDRRLRPYLSQTGVHQSKRWPLRPSGPDGPTCGDGLQ